MVSENISFGFKLIKENLNISYVFVHVYVKVNAPTIKEDSIKKIPRWVGFTIEDKRGSIYDVSMDSFSDIKIFTEKDISNL